MYRVPVGRTPSLCVCPCVSLAAARSASAAVAHPALALPAWARCVPSACALAPPLCVCACVRAVCSRRVLARVCSRLCVSVRAAYDL